MLFVKNITKNLQVINIIINFAAEFITHKEVDRKSTRLNSSH